MTLLLCTHPICTHARNIAKYKCTEFTVSFGFFYIYLLQYINNYYLVYSYLGT